MELYFSPRGGLQLCAEENLFPLVTLEIALFES
jgi:hypothetical protein